MLGRSRKAGETDSDRDLRVLMHDCFLVLIPALAIFSYCTFRMIALADGDTGWHIAAGQWIAAHRAVPENDIFSYTAKGWPWTAHEWLADVLMAGAYALRGWSAILLLYAAALAALFLTMTLYLRRWLAPKIAVLPVAACAAGLMPFLLARPHVLAWPLLAVWTVALLRAREQDRAPPLAFALAMTVWANVHGSFIFGLLLIGPFALEALLAAGKPGWARVVRDWGLFGVASLIAALINPYGAHGLLFPFQLTSMPALGKITEWLPSDFSSIGVFEVVLLAGLFLCLWRGVKVPAIRLALVIGLLHMALAHSRHQAIFLIVTSLVLAEPLARSIAAAGSTGPRFDLRAAIAARRKDVLPLFGMLLAIAAGMAEWRLAVPAARPDSAGVPVTAVARLPAQLKRQPVFNEYSFGGQLALNRIPVFIDGRVDMYGEGHLRYYLKLVETPDAASWQAAQRRWNFRWTILPPGKPLVKLLDRQPGWRRLYADKWAVVHVTEAQWRELQAGR